jgi:hypothetical protein
MSVQAGTFTIASASSCLVKTAVLAPAGLSSSGFITARTVCALHVVVQAATRPPHCLAKLHHCTLLLAKSDRLENADLVRLASLHHH